MIQSVWLGEDEGGENGWMEFTKQAVQAMTEREIALEWLEHAVAEPDLRVRDPNDPELERFFRRVPERDDHVLRVVVNTHAVPW